jgi:type I restriction enzyme M protein
MQWAYETFGERVYTELPKLEKDIVAWCERNELDLNAKKRKDLCSPDTWQKHRDLLQVGHQLMGVSG